MVFFIGRLCNLVGKGYRLTKILEPEIFFQVQFTVFFISLPTRQFFF